KILVMEDDQEINDLLCEMLMENGYAVEGILTGTEGLVKLRKEKFDLLLLDLMLPYKSGDAVLSELRLFSTMPVIIISAKDLIKTKVDLFRMGADDYLTKPFDLDEVLVRVEAVLRRYRKAEDETAEQIFSFKDIILKTENKTVFVAEKKLTLTAKEYAILELMLRYPKKIYSKANLFQSIWNEEYACEDNTLNVHMSNLRNKLKAANPSEVYIKTVWGMGYRLAE
ncbi:MAG: response regulator transcription factor, partial [Eubacterium sp.]